jgi:hypothetical protein
MEKEFENSRQMFGTRARRLPVSKQKQAGYQLWWEFFKRNEEYKQCCVDGVFGKYPELYDDFGNIHAYTRFRDWWEEYERGRRLFGDLPLDLTVHELKTANDWDIEGWRDQAIVVVLPLNHSKRYLMNRVSNLLKAKHPGKPGRKTGGYMASSTAKYKFHRNFSVLTLENQLKVYDAVMGSKSGVCKRKLADIGVDLGLVPTAMPDPGKDRAEDTTIKRALLASTVSRLFRQAERIVHNTIKGQFPNSKD